MGLRGSDELRRADRVAFPECFIEQPSAAQILSKAPVIH
jgi:hypothetical protein